MWEERQKLWYALRHDGLRRRNKPFKGAADLHLPIADNAVEKLKPYYINSIFSRQQLASFTPLGDGTGDGVSGLGSGVSGQDARPKTPDAIGADASAAAAQSLDWRIRNETNFKRKVHALIDSMLVCGRGILKVRWDKKRAGVVYENIDPLYFIVPRRTDELDEADWCVHCKQMSVAAYERDGRYLADEETLNRIRGGDAQSDRAGKEQEKAAREGLTYSNDKDEVVLWECFEHDAKGWTVRTYSPAAPELKLREDFRLGYRMRGEPMLPFVSWQFEIGEDGWYAPRGVVERVAPFETYGTKLWNAKADFLEYCFKPLFTQTAGSPEIRNTTNIRLAPGEVMPPGLTPVTMPTPPVALDEEINNTRAIAEETVQLPDFGVQREGDAGGTNKRTATELDYIGSFASQGIQYRGQISGMSEGETYRKTWALYVQFGGQEQAYFASRSRKVLPVQALHDNYLIEPDGTPDQWNKTQRVQRSIARYQMFRGHPNVNQEELVKSILEDDDPRLVKRLFLTTAAKAGNESEDEAVEIMLLMNGWPAVVNPEEDHALRIKIIAGKMAQLQQHGVPVDPVAQQRLQQHLVQHLMFLKKQNPVLARQIEAAIHALDGGAGAGSNPQSAIRNPQLELSPGVAPGAIAGRGGASGFGAPAPELGGPPAEGMAV